MSIYEHYGPTEMKLEGPNNNGLSWIKFHKVHLIQPHLCAPRKD